MFCILQQNQDYFMCVIHNTDHVDKREKRVVVVSAGQDLISHTPGALGAPGILGTPGAPVTPGILGTPGAPGTPGTPGALGARGTPGALGTPSAGQDLISHTPGTTGTLGAGQNLISHTPGVPQLKMQGLTKFGLIPVWDLVTATMAHTMIHHIG